MDAVCSLLRLNLFFSIQGSAVLPRGQRGEDGVGRVGRASAEVHGFAATVACVGGKAKHAYFHHGGKQSYRSHPPQEIHLKNKFNILYLQGFPPSACHSPAPRLCIGGPETLAAPPPAPPRRPELRAVIVPTPSHPNHGSRSSSRGAAPSQNKGALHSLLMNPLQLKNPTPPTCLLLTQYSDIKL